MEHQDWEKYIIHCKINKKNTEEQKIQKNLTKEQKIEKQNDEGKLKHKKINKEFSKRLQQARLNKKLTQKQLAQKINVDEKTIKNYCLVEHLSNKYTNQDSNFGVIKVKDLFF